MARKAAVAESLLSIADISRHFSLPESTTRYYCKRFAQFIPSVGDGRRRRYRRETLDVISAILEQMQKSRTAAAVEDALNARFPRSAVAVADASHGHEVADLAVAHVLALKHLLNGGSSKIYNLGSEKGFSVREIIETAKKVTKVDFAVSEEKRRPGDPAVLIASSRKIGEELGWKPMHSAIEEVIASAWQWHKEHPQGYEE